MSGPIPGTLRSVRLNNRTRNIFACKPRQTVITQPFDTNGDGYAEDQNHDGYVDYLLADTNGDSYGETEVTDYNLDGQADQITVDTNGDGHVDVASVDTNSDGIIDGFSSNLVASAGGIVYDDWMIQRPRPTTFDHDAALARVDAIYERTREVLERATVDSIPYRSRPNTSRKPPFATVHTVQPCSPATDH